ncbi:uncharacterized protein LOC135187489 [Pogoniulus pusillus]|uniref:uncharacterized protein LOC135187489 n=1 Tax=Pogoniulus pusillus TaxID=488313 RepID=UPI0030B9AA36
MLSDPFGSLLRRPEWRARGSGNFSPRFQLAVLGCRRPEQAGPQERQAPSLPTWAEDPPRIITGYKAVSCPDLPAGVSEDIAAAGEANTASIFILTKQATAGPEAEPAADKQVLAALLPTEGTEARRQVRSGDEPQGAAANFSSGSLQCLPSGRGARVRRSSAAGASSAAQPPARTGGLRSSVKALPGMRLSLNAVGRIHNPGGYEPILLAGPAG